MDVTQYYAICLGCFFLVYVFSQNLSQYVRPKIVAEKSRIFRMGWPRRLLDFPWIDVGFGLIHLAANVALIALRSRSWREFARYTGILSVINAIPLSLGERNQLLGLVRPAGVHSNAIRHRYMGAVVFCEALAHAITTAILQRTSLHERLSITGLMVR
jgi:hypothetical protein